MHSEMYVAYRQTASKNYQSRTFEFGMSVSGASSAKIGRAYQLAEAVVKYRIGETIGKKLGELNELTREFFGDDSSFLEIAGAKASEDEVL